MEAGSEGMLPEDGAVRCSYSLEPLLLETCVPRNAPSDDGWEAGDAVVRRKGDVQIGVHPSAASVHEKI
jgi:hypothetical protein